MFLFLYSTLLTLGLILSSPWWLWRMLTTKRYREGLAQRISIISPTLKIAVLEARAQARRTIWLHAVSVGEALAAERLIQDLQTALPNHLILISTTTATGQNLARQHFPPAHVFYLPLDFATPVRRYLNLLQPDLLILMESELWPRLLTECNRRHIPVAVANARISDRSFPRYMTLRALWRPILAKVSLFLAQSEETAARLRQIGAPTTRIQTPGNLKYNLTPPIPTKVSELIRTAAGSREIIVAGSTLSGSTFTEEDLVLRAMDNIWQLWPNVLLILAPRHPDRFGYAYSLALEHGVTSATELLAGKSVPDKPRQTILLDTLGDLASVYALAKVAFIGGSLVPRGGHNPLEAARFGVPVIMGPSFENFREIVEAMEDADAIRIVASDDPASALSDAIFHLFMDQSQGRRGKAFFDAQTGATTRTIAALLPLLQKVEA